MSARVSLISHASTSALRAVRFPDDEPLDAHGKAKAQTRTEPIRVHERAITSPEIRTRETANALGLNATADPRLRNCDYGRWTGLSYDAVASKEPDNLALWLSDPTSAPHGGESFFDVAQRVNAWLQSLEDGHTVVVTHPAIIRAAILHTIAAPLSSFWHIDIAPLTLTDLRRDRDRWLMRGSGVPL